MSLRVAIIIAAAGKSARFAPGSAKNKLEQELGGRPLFMRSLELLANRSEVSSIIVGANPDTFDEFQLRHGDALALRGAKAVPGGANRRWETVCNALEAVPDDITHIAVHDGARPCVTDELIDRLFEAAKLFDAVIPGVPVVSTLKRVSEETESAAEDDPIAGAILGVAGTPHTAAHQVVETIDRNRLYEIQTPQIFAAALLRRAYAQNDLSGTDDAVLIERLGEPVRVIQGDPLNLKITTEADLTLARAILGVKPERPRPMHRRF